MALLVLLFIAMPIIEIYVIIQVGQAIGALWTILLLIADSLLGARLLTWQGREAWRRFQAALAGGRMPHNEIVDGVMIILGGALLLTPGFVTDALGLLLIVPPTRALFKRVLVRSIRRRGPVARAVVRSVSVGAPPPGGRARPDGWARPDEPAPRPPELPRG